MKQIKIAAPSCALIKSEKQQSGFLTPKDNSKEMLYLTRDDIQEKLCILLAFQGHH